jgi:hypothetical protein
MINAVMPVFARVRPMFGLLFTGIALAGLAAAPPARADSDTARIAEGIKIAPVPLDLKGLNKNQVGLGSYLVTVAQCNGCHTTPEFAPGSDPFEGDPKTAVVKKAYFAGGVPFGNGICSANITKDKNGLPDGLTLAHFESAMHTGHDFRAPAKQLLVAMPWPYFRDMSDDDLAAVYAYLKAIPVNKTPKCS